jgi:hypothetical protein
MSDTAASCVSKRLDKQAELRLDRRQGDRTTGRQTDNAPTSPVIPPDFPRYVLALGLGAVGGCLFWWLKMPLPWMLGALFANMAAAVAGAPIRAPVRLRSAVVAVIGVLLGSRFTPEVLSQAGVWTISLLLLLVYLLAVGLVVVPFYRFAGKFDWNTAFFSGMPGGLSEMIEIGEARGVKVEQVILAHSLRIVVTIALIAFWFRIVQGATVSGAAAAGRGLPGAADVVLMLFAALAGSWIGIRLKFPAPTFLGPLAISAALHLLAVTESSPPALLVTVAQVALGTILGARFVGIRPRTLYHAAVLGLGATALTLGLAFVFGVVMQRLAGIDTEQALLALAPGGLTEMGLIALAIHADVAFVALHHVVRILVIIVAAPLVHGLLARREK